MSTLFTPEHAPTIQPRKYQLDAFEAVKVYLEYREGNPCVVLPTGAGKTILIVLLCQWVSSWGGRVLILAHVKELLQQAADKLNQIAPELHVGVYSAGLDRREKRGQITIAGIQSIYQRAGEFEPFDLVIIDECHLIPADGEGMYRTFLKDARNRNTNLRMVGLTATPYRLATGSLCGPDEMLTAVCFEVSVLDLINQGFLCPLKSKHVADCDTSGLHVRGGEFVQEEVNLLMSATGTVEAAVKQILEKTVDRSSVLVFCSSVDHATDVCNRIDGAKLITGDTSSDERAFVLAEFKTKRIKYLVNVNVLTTGFDAPNVDCVVLLRPTLSPGLYYQMVGRGFRLSPEKPDCLVLDFGGNIQRHGPINAIRISDKKGSKTTAVPRSKICPGCAEVVVSTVRTCPDCGYQWELITDAKHGIYSADDSIIDEANGEEEYPVRVVYYSRHVKRGSDPEHPATLRVDYEIAVGKAVSEWVCIEHDGYAGTKAKLWWRKRSADPFPESVERAVDIAIGGGLANATKVRFKPDGKYTRITGVTLGPIPAAVEACASCGGKGCEECRFDFADVTPTESSVEWGDVPF